MDEKAADFSKSPAEAVGDTASTIKEDSDAGFQKKSDSSSQAQLKTPSELKQLRKTEKRKRRKEREKIRSLGLRSIQGKVTQVSVGFSQVHCGFCNIALRSVAKRTVLTVVLSVAWRIAWHNMVCIPQLWPCVVFQVMN